MTISIDNSGTSPVLVIKEDGTETLRLKLMRITEHGNLWIPDDMVKVVKS